MTFLRILFSNSRGAAAAEMALLLPLAILLLFGSLEMGYFFYAQHQVVKGVRDGARYASRQSFSYFSCGSTSLLSPAGLPTGTALATKIKNMTRTGRIVGGKSRIPGWTDSDITVTVTCPPSGQEVTSGIYKGMTNAPQVNIATVVSYPSLFGGIGVLNDNFHLRAEQQSAVMGI